MNGLHPHHKKAIRHLNKDVVMRNLIKRYEPPFWNSKTNLFQDLVESVIAQQLSDKAAGTITERFKKLFSKKRFPKTEDVTTMSLVKLRSCGISRSKALYIKGIAKVFARGELKRSELTKLTDAEIMEELTKLKGIGPWTAEMILMFTFRRSDVFSLGDLGLRKAISRLYGIRMENAVAMHKLSEKWGPYRTFAARYLWKSLGEKN